MEGDDAAVAGILLHVVYHVFCRHPFRVVTGNQVPHNYFIGTMQPPVFTGSHPSMGWTEEMGMYQLIRFVGVEYV